jgi:hypothetical protein
MIPIVSRDDWKAQPPVRRAPTKIDPAQQRGWVFHWYGRAVRAGNVPSESKFLQQFQKACINDQQFSDLPHSFYIGHDGTIFEGRGWRWDQFAHGTREVYPLDEGGNLGWYSVCWLGGDNQQPSSAVVKNLTRLVHDSRVELGCGMFVAPYSDWRTTPSPGARLEQLARTLHNWPIPFDNGEGRSVGAAANPQLAPPPRLSPPPPPPSPLRKPRLIQANDGDNAVFVTDGLTKEWIYDRTDAHRMCASGEVDHAGRDDSGEFRPILVARCTLDALKTPGRLPLYPEGWQKGRTCR